MENEEEIKHEQGKTVEDPNAFFDTTMKKKKKKKKDKSAETPAADSADAPVEDPMAMFGEKKKKKKKKTTTLEADTPRSESPADVDSMASFGEKKKKKKKKRPNLAEFEAQLKADGGIDDVVEEQAEENKENASEESWLDSDRDYTYDELLTRIFKILREKNPDLVGEKKRYTIVPPQVHREGSRKTVFFNLVEICKRMHRQPEHVIQYLFAELGTSGSIDGSQRLVIKGRFQQKQIENILKRYIMEYVTCKVCKSPETILEKDNRIFFLHCEACGAVKSVSTIKTGFKAQTEKRAAQRAAQ